MTDNKMDGAEPIQNPELPDRASSEDTPVEVQKLKAWLAENRQALIAAGVASIEGCYYGAGDQGSFDEVVCFNREKHYTDSYEVPEKIAELIESLSDKLATPGYEDNDGGGGTIVLNVEDGTITHQSYWYETERSYDEPEVF